MLRQLAILLLLSITVTVSLSGGFSCYATQQQRNQDQEPDIPIVTQYNNATRNSRSMLQGIPIPISETDEFNHLYVNAAADYSGRTPTIPKIIIMGFGSRPCHGTDAPEPEVSILADGVVIYFGKLRLLVCSGGIRRESEFGTIDIPYNDFVRITEAMRAYVQIGEHQFELGDDARRGFQRLTNFLNGK
jgi:hypothetical protein